MPKGLKYTAIFLSINNETQCVPLLLFHQDLLHMLYLFYSILGKMYLKRL